jgi:uncharacterized phage protein (TIGR01671 family)
MREILFRGKSKDGEWHYGMLATNLLSNGDIRYSIYKFPEPNDLREGINCYCGVIPETIGQYTGLKGYNGKKIFEGDILRIGTCSQAFCVEWDEDKAMFQVFSQYSEYVEAQFDEIKGCIEVVGNIHDNPELLNKLLK